MPVHEDAIALMNQFLAGHFGPLRSSVAPDAYTVRLFIDNPRTDSPAEADWGGYVAPDWDSDDWLTPEGGEVDSDGLPNFGNPTGPGTDAARYWALCDVGTSVVRYSAPLSELIAVTAASANPVKIRLTVPFAGRN